MKQYIIDAFTDKIFSGNTAAVCICGDFPDDKLMQSVARENNLSETAFVSCTDGKYAIRWFTPGGEIDLCGHATLASAYVLNKFYDACGEIVFYSPKRGILKAECRGGAVALDFPSRPPEKVSGGQIISDMERALGCRVLELYKSRDYMAVTDSEETVKHLKPDLSHLGRIPVGECGGFIVTAKGSEADFVSRFFCPGLSVPEDPVTGSSHCTLVPFWSKRLGKDKLTACQLSERGGTLYCEDLGERVKISGNAAVYSIGEIFV